MNLTAHSHFSLQDGQRTVLEMIATGAPLGETLDALVRLVEAQEEGVRCGILIVAPDGKHFRRGAGPNLPDIYHEALDGAPIKPPYLGPCGEVADTCRPVVVPDIANDPIWSDAWRRLVLSCGFRSMRSTPVVGSDGRVLGAFAMYYDRLRDPHSSDPDLIGTATHLAGIALQRDAFESELRERDARYRGLVEESISGIAETDRGGRFTAVDDRYCAITGYSRDELLGLRMQDITHPDDLSDSLHLFDGLAGGGNSFAIEKRYLRKDGSTVHVHNSVSAVRDADGSVRTLIAMTQDISDRKRAEALQAAQRSVMELAVRDAPLSEVLEMLVRTVEAQSQAGMLGSILLLDDDGVHLRHGSAPSLPDAYNKAIDGIEIGPGVGSCGTAAYTGKPVYVSDIATDPLWADFAELALSHNLRACWSTPICSVHGKVLGTFALYYHAAQAPEQADLELLGIVSRSASLVIERKRAQEALLRQTRHLEALNRISKSISSDLDLEHIVQTVTDNATELIGAKFGAFFYNLTDAKGERYSLYTLSGASRDDFDRFGMPRNTAVFEPTFRGTGVIRSDDIRKDPRYGRSAPHHGMPKGHLPVVSYLAVPVVSRSGEVHGGLFFAHDRPGVFTAESEAVVTAIASHAAIALDNAHLLQAAEAELTQRRLVEDALRESERKARELIVALPTALYTTDPEGRITSYNDAAVRLWGRAPAIEDGELYCGSLRLFWPDGQPMRHDECPMALALKEERAIAGDEAAAERPDGSRVPFLAYPTPLRDESGQITGAVNMLVEITDRKRAEEQRTLLINELNHRVKNTLATVQSIAAQSFRHAGDTAEARARFEARLLALSKAHDILTRRHWEGADLRTLIEQAVEPYCGQSSDRFDLDGPAVFVPPKYALALAMALHELCTNAVKYGALSKDEGRVEIAWTLAAGNGSRRLHIRWTEIGGPPVEPPARRGFGTRMIERGLSHDLGGKVAIEFAADGVVCTIASALEDAAAPGLTSEMRA